MIWYSGHDDSGLKFDYTIKYDKKMYVPYDIISVTAATAIPPKSYYGKQTKIAKSHFRKLAATKKELAKFVERDDIKELYLMPTKVFSPASLSHMQ